MYPPLSDINPPSTSLSQYLISPPRLLHWHTEVSDPDDLLRGNFNKNNCRQLDHFEAFRTSTTVTALSVSFYRSTAAAGSSVPPI